MMTSTVPLMSWGGVLHLAFVAVAFVVVAGIGQLVTRHMLVSRWVRERRRQCAEMNDFVRRHEGETS